MPPRKTLDDQITLPIRADVKRGLQILAAHSDRKTADLARKILGDYVSLPENAVIIQAAHAAEHNRPAVVSTPATGE